MISIGSLSELKFILLDLDALLLHFVDLDGVVQHHGHFITAISIRLEYLNLAVEVRLPMQIHVFVVLTVF